MAPDDIGHLDEATVARFLDGELPADERERVAAHLEECDECRAELRELSALAESAPAAVNRRGRSRRFSRVTPIVGALAASMAGVAVVRQMTNQTLPQVATRVRAVPEGGGRIEVVSPSSRDVRSGDVRFSWHSANVDAYSFTLLDESGHVLFTTSTADTTMPWPHNVQQSLGGKYFWRVDGIAEGAGSSTGAQRLRIVR